MMHILGGHFRMTEEQVGYWDLRGLQYAPARIYHYSVRLGAGV